MTTSKQQPQGSGSVRYHLFCPYHGGLGVTEALDTANEIAHQHIMDQHVDDTGLIAPGAEVHIQEKIHFTAAHAAARSSPPPAAEEPQSPQSLETGGKRRTK